MPRAAYRTAFEHEWIAGGDNEGLSPPINYTIEGKLLGVLKPGRRILVDRTKRNGVEVRGEFSSSAIEKIDSYGPRKYVYTVNSIYEVTPIE